MHAEAYQYVQSVVAQMETSGKRVLEVGAYNVNGSVRPLFAGAHYHGIDVRAGPGVDEVVDVLEYTPTKKYDIIVTTEMLEHCHAWPAVIAALRKAAKKNTTLIITCATNPRAPHGVDGGMVGTEYYENINADDLRTVLETEGWGDVALTLDKSRGDLYATAIAQ